MVGELDDEDSDEDELELEEVLELELVGGLDELELELVEVGGTEDEDDNGHVRVGLHHTAVADDGTDEARVWNASVHNAGRRG